MRRLLPAPPGTTKMFISPAQPPRRYGDRREPARHPERLLTTRVCSASDVELALLFGLLLFYWLFAALDEAFVSTGVVVGSVWYTLTLGFGAWRCAFAGPAGIWSPLFWFRSAAIVFLGIGTIAYFAVNDVTRRVIDSFHATSDAELLKVSTIVTLGTLAVLAATRSFDRRLPPVATGGAPPSVSMPLLLKVGLATALAGGLVKYLVLMPHILGYGSFVPPGFLMKLGYFLPIGFYFLGSWCVMKRSPLILLVFSFAAADAGVGLLSFNKTDLLVTLVLTGLSLVHLRTSRFKLGLVAAACVLAFLAAIPVVNYGRAVQMERYGTIDGATLGERAAIIADYFGPSGEAFEATGDRSEFQNAWSRISYVNQMGFAVARHDAGERGDSISQIATAVAPRLLWPEKPNMNYLTAGFNEAATGSRESLSWPGQFVEAYWNFGWIGVVACMVPVGIVYTIMTRYALRVFSQGRWIEFPVVLLMMRWASDIMSPYATNVGGGLLTLLALGLVLKAIAIVLRPHTEEARSRPAIRRRDPQRPSPARAPFPARHETGTRTAIAGRENSMGA